MRKSQRIKNLLASNKHLNESREDWRKLYRSAYDKSFNLTQELSVMKAELETAQNRVEELEKDLARSNTKIGNLYKDVKLASIILNSGRKALDLR